MASSEKPQPKQDGNALHRFARTTRVFEFLVAVAVLGVALVFALIDVHDRAIPSIKIQINSTTIYWALDPTINQEELAQQVPMWSLVVGGSLLPIVVNLLMNYVVPRCRHITVVQGDTRDFLLSLLQSIALSQVLTQFIKNQTGRFRPSFHDMCGWQYDVVWDGVTNLCTNSAGEKEGRKSFPSGHSSFAWATMLLLTLYLLGRSRLSAINRGDTIMRGSRKTFKLFVCFLPVLIATWVAITRSIDNWHHYSDILGGSIIGAVSACIAYDYNYGSVFSWDAAGITREELSERHKVKLREGQAVVVSSRTQENGEKSQVTSSQWVVQVGES